MEPVDLPMKPRILVIDDEPVIQRLIARTLANCEVVGVSDARVALERIVAGERFRLVLCDLNMPGMNGMQFHRELSWREPEMARRVLFVSGGGLGAEVQR